MSVNMIKNQDIISRFMELEAATRKKKPKEEDIIALRNELEKRPELVRQLGDLALLAQRSLLRNEAESEYSKEVVEAGLNLKRKELGYEESSEMEKMLIEAVLLAWMRLNICEKRYSNRIANKLSFKEAEFLEKRMNHSQMRFLRAVEKLAKVRSLLKNDPKLQINIANPGGQQINLSGDLISQKDSMKIVE